MLGVGDLFWKHRAEQKKGLFERECDLTKTRYTGSPRFGGLRQFGRSIQHCGDCPLITMAPARNNIGFPRNCEILPGNGAEPHTLEQAMRRLRTTCKDSAQLTVVMNPGIATQKKTEWLCQYGCHRLCDGRHAKPKTPPRPPDVRIVNRDGEKVCAWRLEAAADEIRAFIVCDRKRRSEDPNLEGLRTKLEDAVARLRDGLSAPGCLKRYEKALESVGAFASNIPGCPNIAKSTSETAPTTTPPMWSVAEPPFSCNATTAPDPTS